MATERHARCACGQLTATCVGEPSKVSVCHCLDCQRRTGTAFGVAVFFPRSQVTVSGQAKVFARESDSGFPVGHHFCPDCGSTVIWYPTRKPEAVAVALGCFVERDLPWPHQQVYEHHRHAWVALDTRAVAT